MSMGKSFRTNKDSDMIGFNEAFCRAGISYIKEGQENQIDIVISEEGKSIKIDGVKAKKTSDLLEHVYTVIFSPEDLKIVKDEPEKRRKFIDRELCQLKPIYYNNLGKYKRILFQRNTLLKYEKLDLAQLEIWDQSLAEYGAKIILDRNVFIDQLKNISKELHRKITNGKEELELFYEGNIDFVEDYKELQEKFIAALRQNQKRDQLRGNTGTGPHKDDIKLTINGIDIRQFGSQGQQRTAVLSLKLAEIQLIKNVIGEDAILLLDDVLSELDEDRQHFLIKSLSDVQLFITTTEIGGPLLDTISDGDIYRINQGGVEKTFDNKSY